MSQLCLSVSCQTFHTASIRGVLTGAFFILSCCGLSDFQKVGFHELWYWHHLGEGATKALGWSGCGLSAGRKGILITLLKMTGSVLLQTSVDLSPLLHDEA